MRSSHRSQPIEELGEEAVEYAPSDEGDVIYQLGEKIRAQAKRLSSLEQYKVLCERRILELSPGHELPVRQEHLGTASTDAQRLHQMQQHIARLEQQLGGTQVSPNAWSKQDLEESLRAEVLNSEKQRAYIETLKQALEAKMEGLGVQTNIDTFAHLSQTQDQTDQLHREIEKLKGTVIDQEAVLTRSKDLLQSKESALSELRKASESLKQQLSEVLTVLQQTQDDSKKLEIEKNTLLDYIQEQQQGETLLRENNQTLEERKKALESQLALVQEQLKDTKASLNASVARNKQQEEQLQRLISESATAQLSFTQVKSALDVAQGKVKETGTQNQGLNQQTAALQARNESLQTNLGKLTAELKEVKEGRDQCQLELDSVNKQKAYLQESLSAAKELQGEKEAAEFRLKGELRELQRIIQNLKDELTIRTSKIEELTKLLSSAERNQADLEVRQKQKVDELTSAHLLLSQQNSDLSQDFQTRVRQLDAELRGNKSEFASRIKAAESEISRLNQTITELRSDLENERILKEQGVADLRQMQMRLNLSAEDNAALSQELQEMRTELATGKTFAGRQQQTIRTMQEEAARTGAKLEAGEREEARLRTVIDSLSAENHALKSDLEGLHQDLEQISQDVIRNSEEVSETREQVKAAKIKEAEASEELNKVRNFVRGKSRNWWEKLRMEEKGEGDLMQMVSDVFAVVEILDTDLIQSRKEAESLKSAASEVTSDLYHTKRDLSDYLKSDQILRDEVSHLTHELDLLHSQLDEDRVQSTERVSRLSETVADQRREIQRLMEETQALKDQIRAAGGEIGGMKEVNSRLQYQNRSLEEKSTDFQREKRSLELLLAKIVNAIPSPALKSLAVDMIQVKTEVTGLEKSNSQVRSRILDLEDKLSTLQDSRETLHLHRAIQSERETFAQSESALEGLRNRLQDLELQLQETQEFEVRKSQETDDSERTISDLQVRLDRKSMELTQAQYSLLATRQGVQRATSPYKVVKYEARTSPRHPKSEMAVQDRLDQARSTINELKRLSRSNI